MALRLSELLQRTETGGPRNLALELPADQLSQIGHDVVEEYDLDVQSRVDWFDRTKDAIDLAMQIKKDKTYPWPNAANVKFPLLTIAALQFHARVYPNVISESPVKYKVIGNHQGAVARGSRIATHMNYQLLEEDEDWEEQMDTLLLAVPITGCEFDKKFYDPVAGHPITEWVSCRDLVVPYKAKSLGKAARITHEIGDLLPRDVEERMRDGRWMRAELGDPPVEPADDGSDERSGQHPVMQDPDAGRPILEQHRYLDLDEDGYTEPYIVTVDRTDEQVLRIVPRFGPTSVKTDMDDRLQEFVQRASQQIDQLAQAGNIETAKAMQREVETRLATERDRAEILSIRSYEHFTRYNFLPSIDGGIYGQGLGNMQGPLNAAVDTLINQLIDAGTLSNLGGGFKARGAKLGKAGSLFFQPGEWKAVDCTGDDLRKNLVPHKPPTPSPVLFNLLGLIIDFTQQVGSVNDMMVGKTPGQNTPASTSAATLEQGMALFSGIYKRLLRSFKRSYQHQYRINRETVDPAKYAELLGGDANLLMTDYRQPAKHCRPAADPNMVTDQQKMVKANALATRAEMVPGYDKIEVEHRWLRENNIEDPERVFPVQDNPETGQRELVFKPGEDPEIAVKREENARRVLEAKTRHDLGWADVELKTAIGESTILLNEAKALETGAKADMAPIKEAREILKAIQEKAASERAGSEKEPAEA